LAFGKSYTWRDGVRVTVGKPRTFKPSRYAVVEKSKHYVKFPITVLNKAEKPIDIGWTHINVQSNDKEADQFYDSLSGLKGPPATKVSKGREAAFEVGFAVADPDDLTMELALDGDRQPPRVWYST
jgi:ABC-type molybdate transport system substrate-binding protein